MPPAFGVARAAREWPPNCSLGIISDNRCDPCSLQHFGHYSCERFDLSSTVVPLTYPFTSIVTFCCKRKHVWRWKCGRGDLVITAFRVLFLCPSAGHGVSSDSSPSKGEE